MNFATSITTRALKSTLRSISLQATKQQQQRLQPSVLQSSSARSFSSSFGEESPLDAFLKPGAPTPLYNSTEFHPLPSSSRKLECGVDESVLRFKTHCYGRLMTAPFVHPNEHKITMTVPIADLPLATDLERDIFKEIVGRRWQEERGEVRMSSVAFGSRIENKRHLVSMLDKLVLSSQRLAAQVRQKAAANNQATSDEAA